MSFKQIFLRTNQYIHDKMSTSTAKDTAFLLGTLGGITALTSQQHISDISNPVVLGSLVLPIVAVATTKTIAQITSKINDLKQNQTTPLQRKFTPKH